MPDKKMLAVSKPGASTLLHMFYILFFPLVVLEIMLTLRLLRSNVPLSTKHMRKFAFFLCLAALAFSASAADWFPFRDVNHNWNISFNGGYSPSGRVPLYGFGLTVRGIHLTVGGLGSTHEHDVNVGTWNEKASFTLQAGYQIPLVKSFRIIPVIGTIGIGEAVTDGWDWSVNQGQITNKVSSEIKYKFDYGVHLVFNHRKLIINLGATRYTLLGGLGLEF